MAYLHTQFSVAHSKDGSRVHLRLHSDGINDEISPDDRPSILSISSGVSEARALALALLNLSVEQCNAMTKLLDEIKPI